MSFSDGLLALFGVALLLGVLDAFLVGVFLGVVPGVLLPLVVRGRALEPVMFGSPGCGLATPLDPSSLSLLEETPLTKSASIDEDESSRAAPPSLRPKTSRGLYLTA